MCTRAKCAKCSKATWRGCGAHIQQVLAGVPKPDRCRCETHQPESLAAALMRAIRGG